MPPLNLHLVVIERQILVSLVAWICQKLPSCCPLHYTDSWFFWFCVRGEVRGALNKGRSSHNGCLNQQQHMAGLHQGHALIILEPTEVGRKTEGWGKSAVFPHPLDIITLLLAITFTTAGLFRTTPGNISAKYSTDFTPAGWTFLIWNVIYTWQLAWLLYALSGICRRYFPYLLFTV